MLNKGRTQSKKAVVLVNVGTPDAPTVSAVRRYLRQFLSDPLVITLPPLLRTLLVRGIIVPFRAPRSAKLYQSVWTSEGSPLLVEGRNLQKALQEQLNQEDADTTVFLAMRYGSLSLSDTLATLAAGPYSDVCILPLYPHYAQSTTGSVEKLVSDFSQATSPPYHLSVVPPFYSDPGFIAAFVQRIEQWHYRSYDHLIFSFHGLPLSHVEATHKGKNCEHYACTTQVNSTNKECYNATCHHTARLLAEELGLSHSSYSVGYQSRLGTKWLSPNTEDLLTTLAQGGAKRILVVAPSFVADCLETLEEIGLGYKEHFLSLGGESLELVESLNASAPWVSYMAQKVRRAFA